MDIDRLRYFRKVFEYGHLRKAAETLFISPGALSKAVKTLEDELQIDLFVKQGRQLIPTQKAQHLYHSSHKLIEEFEKVQEQLHQQTESKTILRLASWEVFSSYFAPYFMLSLQKDFHFTLLERSPLYLEESILQGNADFGLSYDPIGYKELSYKKIGSLRFTVFCKKDSFQNIPLKELPFVSPCSLKKQRAAEEQSLDCWPRNLKRKHSFECDLLESALELCRKGAASIFCPQLVIDLQNKKLKEEFQLAAWKHKTEKNPLIQKDVYYIYSKEESRASILNILPEHLEKTFSEFK